MDTQKIKNAIKNLEVSLKKLDNKDLRLYFFVADTKGTPSDSLLYEYQLAVKLKELGYDVHMLHGEKEFVGVESWLGETYSSLPHHNIEKDNVEIGVADILILPELFSNVMAKTKTLPCKRIVLLQNFDYLLDTIPMGATLEGLGIRDCITTSNKFSTRISTYFKGMKNYVVRPAVPQVFSLIKTKRKLIVNIVSKNQAEANNIVKPFQWKFPQLGFVTFRFISNQPVKDMALYLNEGDITVWIDDTTDFGIGALQAMAAGNIVIGKIPENEPEWMLNDKGELKNNGLWFYKKDDIPAILDGVVQGILKNEVPSEIVREMKSTVAEYTDEKQMEDVKATFDGILDLRKKELTVLLDAMKNNLNKQEEE